MDSKNIKGLCEAYIAVYDEDLRDELEDISLDEDLSFVDDLSDNELDQVMENLFVVEEIDIDECFNSLEYVLSEATVTSSEDRPSGSARVTTSAQRPSRVSRTAERQRQLRVGRLSQAAQRTGEKLASAARSKGTSVSGRVGQASAKIKSAAQKVKGFLGKVGRAAQAGAKAAKKEFSGEAGREAQARTTGRQMRRAARRQASAERGRDTSAFKTTKALSGTPERPALPAAKTTKALPGTPERPALPAARTKTAMVTRRQEAAAKLASAASGKGSTGVSFAGPGGVSKPATTKKAQQTSMRAASGIKRSAKKAKSVAENYELLADIIAQDLIAEGYASDIFEAYDIIIEMNETDAQDIVESYLYEEVETLDFYDVVLEYLLDEGYAETPEAAEVIMVNMSQEWKNEILDEMQQIDEISADLVHRASKEAGKRAGIYAGLSGGDPKVKEKAKKERKREEKLYVKQSQLRKIGR